MRFSPKEMLVKRYVRTTMVWWQGTICHACNYTIMFETMYKIDKQFYCMGCCDSKESAFDLVFPKKQSAHDIVLKVEKEKVREALKEIIYNINNLPDGEVSPSIYNIILPHTLGLG